jgi:hypothetical protein
MTIKGIRIFRSKSFQNVPKLGLWFETNHLATLIVTRVQLSFTIEVFADSVFDFESERGNAKIKILFFFPQPQNYKIWPRVRSCTNNKEAKPDLFTKKTLNYLKLFLLFLLAPTNGYSFCLCGLHGSVQR